VPPTKTIIAHPRRAFRTAPKKKKKRRVGVWGPPPPPAPHPHPTPPPGGVGGVWGGGWGGGGVVVWWGGVGGGGVWWGLGGGWGGGGWGGAPPPPSLWQPQFILPRPAPPVFSNNSILDIVFDPIVPAPSTHAPCPIFPRERSNIIPTSALQSLRVATRRCSSPRPPAACRLYIHVSIPTPPSPQPSLAPLVPSPSSSLSDPNTIAATKIFHAPAIHNSAADKPFGKHHHCEFRAAAKWQFLLARIGHKPELSHNLTTFFRSASRGKPISSPTVQS